jgi:Ca2+-dependent lipid-binding protein
MSVGKLHIQLVEAHLTHDVKKIGKMDPYVKIEVRDFVWKSKADKNGSKKPEWHDEHFTIDVKYLGDDIYYKVFDEDKGRDEKVGDGGCKISTFCA